MQWWQSAIIWASVVYMILFSKPLPVLTYENTREEVE